MTQRLEALLQSLGAGASGPAEPSRDVSGGSRFEALLADVDLSESGPGSLRERLGGLLAAPERHDDAHDALAAQIARAQRSGRPEDVAKLAIRLSHYTTETQLVVKVVQKSSQAFTELSRMQ